jgi:hypothetical protein
MAIFTSRQQTERPMASWLAKATKSFVQAPPKPSVPFGLGCACGRRVTGIRKPKPQRFICPDCSEWLFVLPNDPYPLVEDKKRKKKKQEQPKTKTKATPVPSVEPRRPKRKSPDRQPTAPPSIDQSRTDQPQSVDQPTHQPADTPPVAQPASVPADTPLRRPRKVLLTRFRLVLIAIVLVIMGTIGWGIRNRLLARAETTLREAMRRSQAALIEDDFETASGELQTAVAALDTLGRDDVPARRIRQQQREVTAIHKSMPVSLVELLHEAEQARRNDRLQDWHDRFRLEYAETWIIFDTSITPISSTENSDTESFDAETSDQENSEVGFEVDYPLAIQETPIDLSIVGPVGPAFPSVERAGRVVFAAQLQSIRVTQEKPLRWIISLRGTTAFGWSGADTYVAIGLPIDEDTQQILKSQARRIGVEP